MIFSKLNISGKEIPADFHLYFDENGIEKTNPYEFGTTESRPWIKRREAIALLFMTKEEKEKYLEFKEHYTRKQASMCY